MATTVPIPLTVLTDGDHTWGPAPFADSFTMAQVTVDRSIVGGMNSKTSSTTLTYHIMISTDGGVTYPFGGSAGPVPGGTIIGDRDDGSLVLMADSFGVGLPPGTGRMAKATITCVGGPVSISGSLVLS